MEYIEKLKELSISEWFYGLYLEVLKDYYISGILIGSIIGFILLYKFLERKSLFFLFSIYLPATYFHELAHFFVSFFMLGRPKKFSVLPKRTENGWTLGFVESYGLNWFNTSFVALAPAFLLPLCFLFFEYSLNETVWYWILLKGYLCANLLLGMKPSSSDFELAMRRPIPIIIFLLGLGYYLLGDLIWVK